MAVLACDFHFLILMNRSKEKAEAEGYVVCVLRFRIKCMSTVAVSMYFILTVHCIVLVALCIVSALILPALLSAVS